LFSHFIPCGVREAVYILDGLMKNTSEIQPETVHSDSHGQSEAVFGLAYLLGIKLMPRIKNCQPFSESLDHTIGRIAFIARSGNSAESYAPSSCSIGFQIWNFAGLRPVR